jgi:hypothetical protein
MKVRFLERPDVTGVASSFNTHGLGEVILGFDGEGGADSCYISDLEVFLEARQEWKDMQQAFRDRDLIIDNYNTIFAEPRTAADRERGYFE